MKYIKYQDTIEDVKEVPGLFRVKNTYKISEAKASLEYLGPFITQDMWRQILSFFAWTNREHHSESQVRWYINMKEARWAAWAYPQKERTGMSAQELGDTPEFKEQRAQFNDDWEYFGTVHHHCNGGAFQSGVDETNEKGQDGLHVTVGHLDKEHHSIHCRVYQSEVKFEQTLDMSTFWDIGKDLMRMIPADLWDKVARYQMGVASNVPFPEAWKNNVIPEPKVITVPRDNEPFRGPFGYGCGTMVETGKKKGKQQPNNSWERAMVALKNILQDRTIMAFQDEDLIQEIGRLAADPLCRSIVDECVENQISLSLLNNRVSAVLAMSQKKAAALPEKSGMLTDEEAMDLMWNQQ